MERVDLKGRWHFFAFLFQFVLDPLLKNKLMTSRMFDGFIPPKFLYNVKISLTRVPPRRVPNKGGTSVFISQLLWLKSINLYAFCGYANGIYPLHVLTATAKIKVFVCLFNLPKTNSHSTRLLEDLSLQFLNQEMSPCLYLFGFLAASLSDLDRSGYKSREGITLIFYQAWWPYSTQNKLKFPIVVMACICTS